MAKVYGYCRCSTNDSKQDVDRQAKELKEMGATNNTIYKEYVSSVKNDKTELNKMFAAIDKDKENAKLSGETADITIAVTEISRITRSTKQLCEIIEIIKAKQLRLVIKNSITIDCTTGELDPMTNAFLLMAGVFAELEHGMIKERVKSGVANARAKGKQIGRPTVTIDTIPVDVKKHYNLFKDGEIGKSKFAKMCGISRPTLDKYIYIIENQ